MKANEAPEKIYLPNNPVLFISNLNERTSEDDIEYTRTDAFIEKARKWFEKQNEWYDLNGVRHCDLEDFEDFKNYMKGE